MSDNANKFGTDISSIQTAYQDFAKDNYTLLDNLRLGYGGSQAEMARLINDTQILGENIRVDEKTVKDVPFDKIILAIHQVQEEMGITGTTAAEAADTIEGSTGSMKAAWENLKVGLADGTQDTDELIDDFVDSFMTAAENLVPRIVETVPRVVTKLEKLYSALGCSKIIVTSGYRCPTHDRTVGGNGSGQHTKGNAADIKCYDKSGNVISTKLIACKAQDLGFTGIGNIDSTYTAIHVDVRTGSKWYGDEAVPGGTSGSVTSDYYSYYSIARQTAAHTWSGKVDAEIVSLQEVLRCKGENLVKDGIAGEQTLAACKKYTIELGDRGDLTRWVQLRLGIVADGIAGQQTMNAIADFQRKNGLGEGYLGGEDWYYLIK